MKTTEMFAAEFQNSEFSKQNIYMHFQFGLPMLIYDREKPTVKWFLHHVRIEGNKMIWSEPKTEVILSYPSGKLIRFAEISPTNEINEISIKENGWHSLKYTFQEVYEACDDVLEFWDKHHTVTKVVLDQYQKVLSRGVGEIGFDVWYGKTGGLK